MRQRERNKETEEKGNYHYNSLKILSLLKGSKLVQSQQHWSHSDRAQERSWKSLVQRIRSDYHGRRKDKDC